MKFRDLIAKFSLNPHGDADHTPKYIEAISQAGVLVDNTQNQLDFSSTGVVVTVIPGPPFTSVVIDTPTIAPCPIVNLSGAGSSIPFGTIADGNHGHGVLLKVISRGVNYTITTSDFVVLGIGGAGGITLTLPPANIIGLWYFIKKTDAGAGAVTVSRAGADTIEGAATVVLAAQYNSVLLMSTNGLWLKMAST